MKSMCEIKFLYILFLSFLFESCGIWKNNLPPYINGGNENNKELRLISFEPTQKSLSSFDLALVIESSDEIRIFHDKSLMVFYFYNGEWSKEIIPFSLFGLSIVAQNYPKNPALQVIPGKMDENNISQGTIIIRSDDNKAGKFRPLLISLSQREIMKAEKIIIYIECEARNPKTGIIRTIGSYLIIK